MINSIDDIKEFISELQNELDKDHLTHNEKFRFETMLECLRFMWKRLEREAKIHSQDIKEMTQTLNNLKSRFDSIDKNKQNYTYMHAYYTNKNNDTFKCNRI